MNIPRRALGFVYKTCSAQSDSIVKLTAFINFTCPDSKRAFPVLVDLASKLSGKKFELVLQPFPIPHHRNSHIITKLAHVVNKTTDGKAVYPFISSIFEESDKLETGATHHQSDDELLDMMIPMAALASNMSIDKTKRILSERSHEMAARLDFKYSCTRGVYLTPTFMLNDVMVAADPTWTLQDWLSTIDPLL